MSETNQDTVVDEQTTDKETADVDETTTQDEETNKKSPNDKKGSKTKEYIERLQTEKSDSLKRAEELEERVKAVEAQREIDVAIAKYGEEAILDDKVQEYRKKTGLSFEECMKLADVEPSPGMGQYAMSGRPKVTISEDQKIYTEDQLLSLKENTPEKYREVIKKISSGEATMKG